MTIPQITIINCETGEIITRDMTPAELLNYEHGTTEYAVEPDIIDQ
jgi:hypothetical protein